MTARVYITGLLAMVVLFFLGVSNLVYAQDMDDGISKFTDESISGDDQALKPDTNINFIVLEAISTSQKGQGDSNSNFNDGSGDNNENSIVFGPGAKADKVINVVIER